MRKVMASSEGNAFTSSVDLLGSRLLPCGNTPKKLSATSTALHEKIYERLHTLIKCFSNDVEVDTERAQAGEIDVLNWDQLGMEE
jgi:hypothetical protein